MLWVVFINGFFEDWFLVSARAERIVNQGRETCLAEFSLKGVLSSQTKTRQKKAGPGIKTWSGIIPIQLGSLEYELQGKLY
jgi:hypothetical protein